jgi:cellobiose-specific phosphotransferase system component IIC
MDAGEDVTGIQILLNIAVTAANGLAIFAIGWLIDRRRASFGGSDDGIIRATIIASILATGLWFFGLLAFGDRINLYGTVVMGGSGGAIAMLAAIIQYRRRRARPAEPRADAIRDIFS